MAPPYSSDTFDDTLSERLGASFVPNQPDNSDQTLGTVDSQTTSKYQKLALERNLLTLNTAAPFAQNPLGCIPRYNGSIFLKYGFPANNKELVWNRLDSQAMAKNCIIGKIPAGIVFQSGDSARFKFGSDTPSGDEVYYDPLNLRAKGDSVASYDAFGYNGKSLQCPGLIHVEVFVSVTFSDNNNNMSNASEVKVKALHKSTSGVLLREHLIGSMETGAPTMTKHRARHILTYDTSQMWREDEYMEIEFIHATPPFKEISCTINDAQCVVTWWPNP